MHAHARTTATILALVALAAATACRQRDPREWTLRHTVQFVKETLERAGGRSEPSPTLRHVLASGATVVEYIGAHMPDDEGYELIGFEVEGPTAPWIVVVRDRGGGTYEIEGYGESLARPVVSTIATVPADSAPPAPG